MSQFFQQYFPYHYAQYKCVSMANVTRKIVFISAHLLPYKKRGPLLSLNRLFVMQNIIILTYVACLIIEFCWIMFHVMNPLSAYVVTFQHFVLFNFLCLETYTQEANTWNNNMNIGVALDRTNLQIMIIQKNRCKVMEGNVVKFRVVVSVLVFMVGTSYLFYCCCFCWLTNPFVLSLQQQRIW